MSVKNKATNKHKLPPEDLETKQTAASITETRTPCVMQCEANTAHCLGARKLRTGDGEDRRETMVPPLAHWLYDLGEVTNWATISSPVEWALIGSYCR